MPLSRRDLLRAAGVGAVGLSGLPASRRALAAEPVDRRFVFVFAYGGWDPSRILAGPHGLDAMDVEADATAVTDGPVGWVDHPERPSVREFFLGFGDRVLVLDGLEIDSVSHNSSVRLALTGATGGANADWATRLAAAGADRFPLPHVVVRGPSLPGALAPMVTRVGAGAGLEQLLDGRVLSSWEGVGEGPSAAARSRVDAFVQRATEGRAAMLAGTPAADSYGALAEAQGRARWLEALGPDLSWPADDGMNGQVDLALDLLELGAARCVTLGADTMVWDTHSYNDLDQSRLFEELFGGLVRLQQGLAERAGSAGSLADETVVVVMSEMGRTPRLNGAQGKDHWPASSALLFGAGVRGGQVVGAYDEGVRGVRIDPDDLSVDEGGIRLDPRVLGATLLALGGEEDAESLAGGAVLQGALD